MTDTPAAVSYWVDQIRADLRSRRETECGHGAKCNTCQPEMKEIEK